MSFSDDDRLVCSPSQCPASFDGPGGQPFQMVPFGNGQCYALGTRGPCPASPFHLLGYDIFERKAVCVNSEDPSSPYFLSDEEDASIDSFYNQLHPEFDDFHIVLVEQNLVSRNDTAQRRQGSGLFQLPSRFPDSLLGGCRPGGTGCVNPIVYIFLIFFSYYYQYSN